MGRTKRRRSKRSSQSKSTNLDHEESTVNLRKWLKSNYFSDPLDLQLRNFIHTGRGVTSKTSVTENDVLIRVPLDLLITFDTVEKSGLLKCLAKNNSFNMQTIMAVFLAIEKHKGEQSFWKKYIDTLPNPEPLLPWMCQSEELSLFPKDIEIMARKLQESFNECFLRLRKSIAPSVLCRCCEIPIVRVLNINLFKWAYVLVNTRAVYIDPKHIFSMNVSILSDQPSMALCPFLDMFNHCDLVETKVNVVNFQGQSFYELRTMTGFKKYEQFFISYGSHDNDKLLMEYGFFIPENNFDSVKFDFREIVDVLKLFFDERQYKFIRSHGLDGKDIYISLDDVSYNLKAILFIGLNPGVLNYASIIFSSSYSSDFELVIRDCTKTLLDFKLDMYRKDVERLNCCSLELSEYLRLVKDYLDYRIKYVKKLLKNILI